MIERQLWFLSLGPREYPGFGSVKTLFIVKVSDDGLAPYVAFATEELALNVVSRRTSLQDYTPVEQGTIDSSFYIEANRQALVFASQRSIDEFFANAEDFEYDAHLQKLDWSQRAFLK